MFTRLMQFQVWLCWLDGLTEEKLALACRLHKRKAQHRNNGVCPTSSHPEAIQLSLYLYVLGASLAAGAQSEFL